DLAQVSSRSDPDGPVEGAREVDRQLRGDGARRADAADLGKLDGGELAGAELGGASRILRGVDAFVGRDRDRGLVADRGEILEVVRRLLGELDPMPFHRG